jgi:hypothetical protein
MQLLVRASCVTPPPSGAVCNDTVALGPIPDWVWLAAMGVLATGVVVILA